MAAKYLHKVRQIGYDELWWHFYKYEINSMKFLSLYRHLKEEINLIGMRLIWQNLQKRNAMTIQADGLMKLKCGSIQRRVYAETK